MRPVLLSALFLAVLPTAGCTRTYVIAMRQTEAPIGPDYVVVSARGSNEKKQKVYDCYSKPDGDHWNPTCVRVDFQAESAAHR